MLDDQKEGALSFHLDFGQLLHFSNTAHYALQCLVVKTHHYFQELRWKRGGDGDKEISRWIKYNRDESHGRKSWGRDK